MNISIIAVGKVKEKYLTQGIEEFLKRLTPYAKVSINEIREEQAPENLSLSEMEQVKNKEGERILAAIKADQVVVALAIEGRNLSSEELAKQLDDYATYGKSNVAFVIGGSLGLADAVMKRADLKLSFSRMTFPHQLMRLILVEQIYRAFRINRGEPYHK